MEIPQPLWTACSNTVAFTVHLCYLKFRQRLLCFHLWSLPLISLLPSQSIYETLTLSFLYTKQFQQFSQPVLCVREAPNYLSGLSPDSYPVALSFTVEHRSGLQMCPNQCRDYPSTLKSLSSTSCNSYSTADSVDATTQFRAHFTHQYFARCFPHLPFPTFS